MPSTGRERPYQYDAPMTSIATDISALDLLRHWDLQQEGYIRHRDLRFDAIARTVRHQCGPTPRILDLASGPGSLTRFLRTALPGCSVVGIDKDPVLNALAREVFADDPAVEIRAADLDTPAWLDAAADARVPAADGPGGSAPEASAPFDAIVSSTALHWLQPQVLVRLYGELGTVLREDGVFLDGDHMPYSTTAQPRLTALAAADDAEVQQETFARVHTWEDWWDVALAQDRFREEARERERIWADRETSHRVTRDLHLAALTDGGFREVGVVWQYLDDYVVAGFR
jgi:trans-aconitate 2-methyltransferase